MLVSRPATREYCWSGDLCTEPTGAVTRKESETVNKGRQQLLLTLILYYIKENCIFYHKIHTYLLMSLQCCVRLTVSTAQLPCMFSGHKYFLLNYSLAVMFFTRGQIKYLFHSYPQLHSTKKTPNGHCKKKKPL